jgi:hypothetical protein
MSNVLCRSAQRDTAGRRIGGKTNSTKKNTDALIGASEENGLEVECVAR